MQIQTPFGAQQVDPDTLITFPSGLPGFEDCTHFKFFHQEDSSNPTIFRLQAVEQPDVMFSVADPAVMNVDYHFELSDEEMALLQAQQPTDLLVLLLLYKGESSGNDAPAPNQNVNAALRSPLVLNLEKRLGLQKSLHNAEISVLVKGKPAAA
jgi:flagellar assembly factor FliW